MHEEEFRLMDALGESLLKLKKESRRKNSSKSQISNSDQQNAHKLRFLLGHPDERIQKRTFEILNKLDPNRFQNKGTEIFSYLANEQERANYREYLIHFLTSPRITFHEKAKQAILKNIQAFRNDLITKLASNNDALVQNICEIMHEGYPEQFSSTNYYEIMRSLQDTEKGEILQLVKNCLKNSQDVPWNLRDGLIRILGALNYHPAAELLHQFSGDSDQNVRWTLAISLGKVHTTASVKALYHLLLDENDEIRQAAADSLGKIFPGLYPNKPPQEILYMIGKTDPVELLKMMNKKSFNQAVLRTWRRLEYNIGILQDKLQYGTSNLIDELIQEKIRGIDFGAERTYFLLLSARRPEPINFLECQIKNEMVKSRKAWLERIRGQLQDQFKIHAKEDLFVLL